MTRKKLSIRVGSLVLFIFLVNFLAMKFYWYSSIWWFDMPMHFMGGLWLGLVFVWFFWGQEFNYKLVLKIILGVLIVGISWEVFEVLLNNYTIRDPFSTLDTISDVCFDLAGSFFAILYSLKKTRFQEKNRV